MVSAVHGGCARRVRKVQALGQVHRQTLGWVRSLHACRRITPIAGAFWGGGITARVWGRRRRPGSDTLVHRARAETLGQGRAKVEPGSSQGRARVEPGSGQGGRARVVGPNRAKVSMVWPWVQVGFENRSKLRQARVGRRDVQATRLLDRSGCLFPAAEAKPTSAWPKLRPCGN